MKSDAANNIANDRDPFVAIFHPSNLVARKIILRNFGVFREDSTTSNIFNKLPLKAFRCAKNLKGLLVRSSLPRNLPHQSPGTFPFYRTVCRTCAHVHSSFTITTPKGHLWVLVALIKTSFHVNRSFFAYSRAGAGYFMWHAREYAIRHVS